MVTTFSARLLSLANRCNPIVGGDKKRKSDAVSNFTNSTTADQHQQTAAQPSTNKNNIKMQGGGNHINSYYYASLYTHPNDATSSGNSNKRRRQKEELQYTAATIQSALEDAGRPPMSLERRREHALSLLGSGTGSGTSVDMTSATVMTSSEFDEMENNNNNDTAALKTDTEDEAQEAETSQDVSFDIIGRSRNRSAAAATTTALSSTSNGYGDVSSMYMLGSLVQSTRQYYNYTCCDYDTTTVSTPIISNLPTKKKARYTYTAPCDWTPTSSYCERLEPGSGLADNDKKNIDNDNRSDGQSLNSSETCCSSSSEEEEEDSISSSEEEHEHSDLHTTKDGNGFDDGLIIYRRNVTLLENGAFSIVG